MAKNTMASSIELVGRGANISVVRFEIIRTGAAIFVLLTLPFLAQAQERFVVSFGGFAGYHAPLWAAKDLGFFTKYGINVDPVMISGAARGVSALLSGNTQFLLTDAAGPTSAVYQGADLVFVASALNKFPFSLYTQKEITRPAGLAGKKVSISSFGGVTEWSMLLALREWNVNRDSVTLLANGAGPNRLLALTNKVVDGAVIAPPETAEARSRGMTLLGHFSDLKANFPITVIIVRRAFYQSNRDTIKRFIQAYSESIHQFKTNKEKSIAVYNQRLKLANAAVVEETYNYFAPKFFLPPRVPLDGVRFALDLAAQRATAARTDLTVEKFVDNTIVDQLEREGFFRSIGASK